MYVRITWPLIVLSALFWIMFLVAAFSAEPEHNHGWYDGSCCNGNDCAAILPTGRVQVTNDRVYVHLEPGDHPKVVAPVTFDATGVLKISKDTEYHACLGDPFKPGKSWKPIKNRGYATLPDGRKQSIICMYMAGSI